MFDGLGAQAMNVFRGIACKIKASRGFTSSTVENTL
jgi:hypothetical protein